MGARRYSDHDRLFALRWLEVRGGNVRLAARELGIPHQSLHQWARGARWFGWAASDPVGGPLTGRRVFKGLSLPVSCPGEVVAVDLAKLTAAENAALMYLLARARRSG